MEEIDAVGAYGKQHAYIEGFGKRLPLCFGKQGAFSAHGLRDIRVHQLSQLCFQRLLLLGRVAEKLFELVKNQQVAGGLPGIARLLSFFEMIPKVALGRQGVEKMRARMRKNFV